MFFTCLQGGSPPYSDDPILATYKFCNAYRASDRVSQFLIKQVIYGFSTNPVDVLFRILFFRLFNKIETWQALEAKFGDVTLDNFDPVLYAQALQDIKRQNGAIYGNAFILCANKVFGYDQKHCNHLALLDKIFVQEDLGNQLLAADSLKHLFELLRSLPLLGDFMAYQIAIDFNYSDLFNFSENDFTIAGPGAVRGINKCFADTGGAAYEDIIMYMVENQDKEFERLGLDFRRLDQRPLQAIDCQGLFCETDKYARVKFPQLTSNRVRIKAAYTPRNDRIDYFYPPKWHVRV